MRQPYQLHLRAEAHPWRGRAMAKRPWLHTFVGNLKRMIPGTYHHASPQPLDGHLAELAYRANRRRREASLSDRLIETALADKCRTCRE